MKLESVLFGGIILLILSACGSNNEEKAQEMAANYLKGVLYHFDSYEPLQTKVDSSFVSLTTDKEAIELAFDMLKLFRLAQECVNKIEMAESSMEIWTPMRFSTAFSNGEYRRAKEEKDNSERLLEKTKERIKNQFSKIKDRQASLNEGEFDGWKVYHKFKSLNGLGTMDVSGEYVFFCDADFNERLAYSKEEYDAINKMMKAIAFSDDVLDMIDAVENEMY